MNAYRLPTFCLRSGSLAQSLALVASCFGLIGSVASLDRTAASAGVVQSDAIQLDSGSTAEEVSLLRKAYARLFIANHDYKGHRVDAMKAIAADLLGTDLRGDAKDHET